MPRSLFGRFSLVAGTNSLLYLQYERPRLERPRLERPRLERPRLERPRLERPRLERPRLERPRLESLQASQAGSVQRRVNSQAS
jgi:hypothetical protein